MFDVQVLRALRPSLSINYGLSTINYRSPIYLKSGRRTPLLGEEI
jgi:hypothetical protein